ncbi:UDP-3-O-(3-hydroxymyristoyl)glucosamine N-acyltransferase [Chitinibacter sp. SCUT-21]|uniref:UDP-3-O-(3-hydroxymyristoyl)glucosamine N-acyltransferase n=1 Tax=Chitinibacter sp. SCUT-21 TaxID=2970891 RepID=UPI0035A6D3CF
MNTKGVYLSALAEMFDAKLLGRDLIIDGVASLLGATPGKLVFISNSKFAAELEHSKALAVIVKSTDDLPQNRSYLLTSDPNLLFARVANYFNPRVQSTQSIHPSATIAADVNVPATVEIGPNVVVESGVQIGEFSQLKAGVFIGKNSIIGTGSILMPRVTIYADSIIGSRCVIHSGTVVGSDGFGNAWAGDHWERIPQIGRVVIGDDVEIGANTTIDRGALDDTVIESGVRLDNLIQIAHNVKIGKNTAIAACTGIAGSAEIGSNCLIGGGVLIAGHLKVADRVTILAGSGVPSGIAESGVYASGVPVVPHGTWLKNMVHFRKLDELAKKLKGLEKLITSKQVNQGE